MVTLINYEFHVLVKGKAITEFLHEDKHFIEGRKGSNFEIEFINKSNKRILAIPSVDGINTLNGKDAGDNGPGFIVSPFSTIKIPGWTLDQGNIAKFMFEGKEHSYANHVSSTGTKNTGVIGFRVFDEKILPQYSNTCFYPVNNITSIQTIPLTYTTWTFNSTSPSLHDRQTMLNSSLANNSVTARSAASDISSMTAVNAIQTNAATASTNPPSYSKSFCLGTSFGEKQEFTTTTVDFQRGNVVAQMLLYYDSYKNLAKRGVKMDKQKRIRDLPEAFPSQGCKPPPGWAI